MIDTIKHSSIAIAVTVFLLTACQKTVEYKKFESDADVPRVTLAVAKQDFDTEAAIFIDSRAEPSYKSEHIARSINIPFGTQELNLDSIPKGKKIIIYCS